MRATPRFVELDLAQACRRLEEAHAKAPAVQRLREIYPKAWEKYPSTPASKPKPRKSWWPVLIWPLTGCFVICVFMGTTKSAKESAFRQRAPYRAWLVELADWVRTSEPVLDVRRAEPILDVRRAEPVVPRAATNGPVRYDGMYTWKAGKQVHCTLADGTKLTYIYRGALASMTDLPVSGNQLNDAWIVFDSGHVWIWAIAKGQTRPYWIDP